MSAIIKMFPSTSRSPRYVSFTPADDAIEFGPTRELHGMAIRLDMTFEAKDKFSMSLGTLATDNYHALVSLSPHVAPFVSNLTLAGVWNPHTTAPLHVSFTVVRGFDLAQLGPLLHVHLLD